MMPMGYEYGFDRPLHVVDTRPEEWDAQLADKPFDLCAFVAEANACKAACGVLNVEGFQAMLTTPGNRPVAMGRFDGDSAEASSKAVLAIYNPDANEQRLEDAGDLLRATGGELKDIQQIYPQPGEPQALRPGQSLTLAPLSVRLFEGTRSGFAEKKMTESTIRRPDVTMSQQRIAIERVTPQVEGGRFPAKDVVGSQVTVEADIFCDGHDVLRAVVVFRHRDDRTWQEAPMAHFDNDRWRGNFPLCKMGLYDFHILAWRDLYAGWRHGVEKKKAAHQTITSELLEGRELVVGTLQKHQATANLVKALCETQDDEALHALLCSDETASAMAAFEERANLSSSDHLGHGFPLQALRHKARFGSWYELFPRSQGGDGKRHGTFDDVIGRLPAIREMGFDVLYFPPIHPIGHTNRKGKNNSLKAEPGDVGSVYAIGDETGGHTAIHPQLGTLDDFRRLVAAAQCHGLEIALDFAIQCSLDHPWIKEHPQWFRWRPDGSIHYAENPPKRYEDIVNVEFYGKAFPDSWLALCDVVRFWIDQGVRIFRVDNPHTKPLPFWEWLLREIHDQRPDVFFLSEAFTRPKMMYRLAKVGFEQSYTYFTWRNTKEEITAYMQELAHGVPRDFFGPNFFVNTPDINPPFLQTGGRPAFLIRLALAGLLCGSWGMYNGFELCEATPIPGREEYLDSEKYELKAWDDDRPGHIKDEITDINRIRRENKALWDHRGVVFYNIWDPNLLSFGRWSADRTNMLLVLVNLDPHQGHGADFEVPLWEWGLADHEAVHVDDLCEQRHFVWQGKVQHIWIDPAPLPYRIYRLTPRLGEGR
jgi:starch synthase (maltosyl-transferring)